LGNRMMSIGAKMLTQLFYTEIIDGFANEEFGY